MFRQGKGFFLGVISTLLLLGLVTSAFALSSQGQITVTQGVKLFLHGAALDLKDARGEPVSTFLHQGTTYVPVRGLSEALGKSVFWEDGAVYIDEPLSREARLGLSKVVFTSYYFGDIWPRYTFDFENCQLGVYSEDGEKVTESSYYMPSERQTDFFYAVKQYDFLRWNSPDWKRNGVGTEYEILDGFPYTIEVFFDDGSSWKIAGHDSFPQNWNEMSAAAGALTGGKADFICEAPYLISDERLGMKQLNVEVFCDGRMTDTYNILFDDNCVSHSYQDPVSSKRRALSKEEQLSLVQSLEKTQVLSWDALPWDKGTKTPEAAEITYHVKVIYHTDTRLYHGMLDWESQKVSSFTIDGNEGYPPNWQQFLDCLDTIKDKVENGGTT